jgi:hypothetical protein
MVWKCLARSRPKPFFGNFLACITPLTRSNVSCPHHIFNVTLQAAANTAAVEFKMVEARMVEMPDGSAALGMCSSPKFQQAGTDANGHRPQSGNIPPRHNFWKACLAPEAEHESRGGNSPTWHADDVIAAISPGLSDEEHESASSSLPQTIEVGEMETRPPVHVNGEVAPVLDAQQLQPPDYHNLSHASTSLHGSNSTRRELHPVGSLQGELCVDAFYQDSSSGSSNQSEVQRSQPCQVKSGASETALWHLVSAAEYSSALGDKQIKATIAPSTLDSGEGEVRIKRDCPSSLERR